MTSNNEMPTIDGVTPHLCVRSATEAAELYTRAFGAEVHQRVPAEDGKRLMHCHLRINNGNLFLNDAFPEHGYPLPTASGYTLHLHVEDVDAWWKRAVDAGLEITMALHDAFWGDRYGELRDTFGVQWSIGGPKR